MNVSEAKVKESSRINDMAVNFVQRSRTRKLTHQRMDAK